MITLQAIRIKNQGGIADVFTGYPDPPVKHNGRRITAEGKRNEAKQRDSIKEVFNFERNHTPDMCITGTVNIFNMFLYHFLFSQTSSISTSYNKSLLPPSW